MVFFINNYRNLKFLLKYNYRNQKLLVDHDINKYAVSNGQFKIIDKNNFGFYSTNDELSYFNGASDKISLQIKTLSNTNLSVEINSWGADQVSWNQSSTNAHTTNLSYQLNNLRHDQYYTVSVNDKIIQKLKSNGNGSLLFMYKTSKAQDKMVVAVANKK